MSKNELQKLWDSEVQLPYREKVEKLQQVLVNYCKNNNLDLDIAKEGRQVVYPTETKYNHYFSNGLYIREMFCKKGYLGFILTKPGTKRICYWLEDSIIVTVHPNPDGLTDLDKIEKKMFSSTWEQYDDNLELDVWEMMYHKDYNKKIENEKDK